MEMKPFEKICFGVDGFASRFLDVVKVVISARHFIQYSPLTFKIVWFAMWHL